MHHQRHRDAPGNLLDAVVVDVGAALTLVRAVRGADSDRQVVGTGLFDEPFGLVGVGQKGVFFGDVDIFLDTPQTAQFSLYRHAYRVRGLDTLERFSNVLFQWMM